MMYLLMIVVTPVPEKIIGKLSRLNYDERILAYCVRISYTIYGG